MRTYNESTKSKKTIASMIERKGDDKENKKNGMKLYLLCCIITCYVYYCIIIF